MTTAEKLEALENEMRDRVKRNGLFAKGGITEEWADRLAAIRAELGEAGPGFVPNLGERAEWQDSVGGWHPGVIVGHRQWKDIHPVMQYEVKLDDGTRTGWYVAARFRDCRIPPASVPVEVLEEAELYRWLRDNAGSWEVSRDPGVWTARNGEKYFPRVYFSANGTSYAGLSLDEAVRAALIAAQEKPSG